MSSNLFNQLTSLSPGQRALFEQKLAQRGLKVPTTQIPKRQVAQPPLSFAQQRLWFIQQLDPDSVAYNVASVLRLTGALDVPVLELTLSALVERHETLRTSFERVDGEPVQVVHPAEPVALPVVDLKQIAQTPEDWIAALTQQPFDLTQPLLRLALLRLDEQTHLLAIATHHIISDRWSVMVFLREMTVLYNAFLRGERSPLPPLPIQYGDYAAWQRQQGTHLQKQIAYWKDKLGGELPVLELPYDRPQSASPTYKGAQYPIALSPKLSAALKDLSARSSVTLFTLLLTAFKVLLHRYSDQDDILVGSDVANRDRVETEGLIGLLVNTLVLRSDLSGNPRFGDLLAQVRETVLGALAHQDVPFEKLVEVLNPERHLSQMMPLFQAKLDLQQVRVQPLALSGITLERHPLPEASAKYELRFNLQDTAQGISGQVEYSTDLFDEGTIARMVGHFQTLLAGIVADPTLPLSELPLLSQAEQQQLSAWNQTQQDFPSGCIHHLFEAQAKRTPKATALIWNGDRFSYGELNRRAEGLAHRLVDLGVGLEVPVGVCMARSADMVVGLLAILKAGGAYVPLDPAYPAERLALIVADARISVLLCDGDLPFDGDGITAIDPAAIGGDRISAINPSGVVRATGRLPLPLSDGDHPTIAPHNLAYIIYTSGSTGTPKGVAIEHCSTVAMLHWAKTRFSPAELSGVLAATSICFDLSVFEIFAPLSWGGCVVLAESALVLPKLPAAEAVTLLNTVPSALAELLNINGLPPSVQTVNIAGEALPPALVHRLRQLSHIQRVYNLYGPSEDTTYSTWADVSQLDSSVSRSPIGRPIANTQAYVCDRAGRPVPIGVAGELYLGGAGVARGYLGRPGLTAERFLPNAFNAGAHGNTSNSISRLDGRKGIQPYAPTNVNGVLYKTGDRVRYRADGALEFLGRLDHQVKIRGFRIETGEIEAALAQCPGVKEAVVVAESREGSARLVAYVVLQGVTPADLKAYLAQRLPGYMLPGQIVELEALPRLPNGKVNRRALPEPQIERDAIAFVAPGTLTEAAIADVWRQALTLEAVSIHDNFFDLGGHSLLGMRVIAQLEQALGREVPLKALFQTPTI
ncbi:MAG: amino acid adenylation domain-containing protein, partial [Cyanobacteria bacterium P01_A01_bin.135]